MRARFILPSIAVLFLTSLALAQTTRPTTKPTTEPADYTVKKGTLKLEVSTDTTFQALEPYEVRLKPKAYAGQYVVVSAIPHGATVKKGDTILELDPRHMQWAVDEAENALATARATARKTEADAELGTKSDALALRISEDNLKNAENQLKWFEEIEGPQMLRLAEIQVKMSKAGVEDQDDELDQLRKMYKTEDLTTATADIVIKRAVRRLEVSREMLKVQEERRDKTTKLDYPVLKQRTTDAVEQARQSLASLKVTQAQAAVARKAALTTARIALEQAEQKAGDIKADVASFNFKAPESGVVMYEQLPDLLPGTDKRAPKPGDKLTAGGVIMRLVYPGRLKLDVTLTESQAFWVEPGTKARVTPTAFPHLSYEGATGAVVGGNRTSPPGFGFQVSVNLPQTDPRLVPGMKAKVTIDAGKVEDVLLIPIAAVSDGKVSIKTGGKVEQRPVQLGRSDGEKIEVKEGLSEGDVILASAKK
jgi:multidrug efflux pump subunit AcrA (membrane-fusion protein)